MLSAVDKARVGRVEVLAYARLVLEVIGLVDGGGGGGPGRAGAALELDCLN